MGCHVPQPRGKWYPHRSFFMLIVQEAHKVTLPEPSQIDKSSFVQIYLFDLVASSRYVPSKDIDQCAGKPRMPTPPPGVELPHAHGAPFTEGLFAVRPMSTELMAPKL